MSSQKDTEKLYRDDLEKTEKNKKKKKKQKLSFGIILIILVILILLLMKYLGLGFGMGKGTGKSNDNSTAVSAAESSEIKYEYVDIKVSGSTYIYEKSEITVDEFVKKVKGMSGNIAVRILDDNGTKNAVTQLKNALEKENLKVINQSFEENSSSDTESSQNESGEE